MSPEVIPLGTGAAIPMRERSLSATALLAGGHVLLFDCGEGTQFQLIRAGIKAPRIDAIFITHLHGDHYFGLFGLISTLALLGRQLPLTIVGPVGLGMVLSALPGQTAEELPYPLDIVELPVGFTRETVWAADGLSVEARPIEHRIQAIGYRFQEAARPGNLDVERARALGVTDYGDFRTLKAGQPVTVGAGHVVRPEQVVSPPVHGASFAYITDTRPCKTGVELARDADIVYHEATFASDLAARAAETGHSTGAEAAQVAKEAGAARLLLGHISARYPDPAVILNEARAVFPNTDVAEELKRYPILPRSEPAEQGGS